jgi:hypothetical protein
VGAVRRRQLVGAVWGAEQLGGEAAPGFSPDHSVVSDGRHLEAHAGDDGRAPVGVEAVRHHQELLVLDLAVESLRDGRERVALPDDVGERSGADREQARGGDERD